MLILLWNFKTFSTAYLSITYLYLIQIIFIELVKFEFITTMSICQNWVSNVFLKTLIIVILKCINLHKKTFVEKPIFVLKKQLKGYFLPNILREWKKHQILLNLVFPFAKKSFIAVYFTLIFKLTYCILIKLAIYFLHFKQNFKQMFC